jgi:hypothetical protein
MSLTNLMEFKKEEIMKMRKFYCCPYCARSNVAGCNISNNIYSKYPCFDFIHKLDNSKSLERFKTLCPTCISFEAKDFNCKKDRSVYMNLHCPEYSGKTIKEESEMEDPKYFVFNPKKGLPKHPHATLIEAENEARRIADLEPDTEILVVRVVVGITKPSKQFIYRNYKK